MPAFVRSNIRISHGRNLELSVLLFFFACLGENDVKVHLESEPGTKST